MSTPLKNAIPAGAESDDSDDEWCIGFAPEKKSTCTEEAPHDVMHTQDNLLLLKRAISNGDTATVEHLLNNGMDVETRLSFEWTPLMCAVSVANYDLAKLLLNRGASANFSKDHWTVLMASCTASADEEKIVHCVELLLSRHADPNMVDRSQMTCLMLAARDGYSKVINLLLAYGANINLQDINGYTALAIAVQHGREGAVLKLVQLGADRTIMNKAGKIPADLAVLHNHTQISRILASSSHISTVEPFSSMEQNLSKFFMTNSESPSSKQSATKLDDLELLLHGLDLDCLTDIITDNDITWGELLTMEKEDLEKIGITDPEHQEKLLRTVQQMQLDKVDLDTLNQLGAAATGGEDFQNFLLSVQQQCCYLTETIHDVINRFPSHASQLVFSLDPKKEAQAICNELVMQTNDLHKEVTCLRNLIYKINEAEDCCRPPPPGSHGNWRMRYLTRVVLNSLKAAFLLLLYKAAGGKFYLHTYRSIY
ncbi:ankyrin repeat, SAM and basic leucine zipper domain-containing protein 1 [Echeneis naucrates]|uniref:ankyrin repeat, SAM and basic leucine zipper domain-containing protein 1 n=1 Tax=Echeneis naucrates TaxID=173247 RepID=UPI001113DB42|nr:ankyrin repeat, SAM and basic leucine zipper domain-containing protein 1 [Echeneis naucrates]